jgi:hypothetical protein
VMDTGTGEKVALLCCKINYKRQDTCLLEAKRLCNHRRKSQDGTALPSSQVGLVGLFYPRVER